MKTVIKTSIFPASKELVFKRLLKLKTLQYIAYPYATFTPLDGNDSMSWEVGSTSRFKFRLFGFIPFGVHTIHVIRFGLEEGIYTREGNVHVPTWNHEIIIERLPGNRCRYTDKVDIDAGWKTIFIWMWANCFYAHRQKMWIKLLSRKKYLQKHVMYSPLMEKIIKEHLRERYPKAEVEPMWEKVRQQYLAFLKELPYLGGKKNTHNGTGGTYDCIMIFAYYEALNHTPDLDELYDINCEAFLPGFKGLAKVANANNPFVRRILHMVFNTIARSKYNCDPKQPTGYIMKVDKYDKAVGPRYIFERCPVAEFAKEHGYLDIMPAICNSDYAAMEMIHGHLIRRNTCANADICDYWIVGDKSKAAKEHPKKTDDKGYWYND